MVAQTYPHAVELGDWGGYRYFVSKEKFHFWDAEQHLQSIDTSLHLLSVHSFIENMYVYNKVGEKLGMSPYPPYYWLGGHDENEEGQWEWIDGTQWDYDQWTTDTSEAQYGSEPNNLGGNEHYLMVYYYSSGGWNDATNNPGDWPFHYVFKAKIITSQDTTDNTIIQTPDPIIENKVYPVPMNQNYGQFTFETDWDEPTRIVLTDCAGKVVLSKNLEEPETVNVIELPLLAAGVYNGIAISGRDRFRFKLTLTN
jgi:hypothetical protein